MIPTFTVLLTKKIYLNPPTILLETSKNKWKKSKENNQYFKKINDSKWEEWHDDKLFAKIKNLNVVRYVFLTLI